MVFLYMCKISSHLDKKKVIATYSANEKYHTRMCPVSIHISLYANRYYTVGICAAK